MALRKFGAFCEERQIDEVNNQNVYEVLNSFMEWNDARGIRSKTIIDYLRALRGSSSTRTQRWTSTRTGQGDPPVVTKIDDQPLVLSVIRDLLSRGRPGKKMMALILTLRGLNRHREDTRSMDTRYPLVAKGLKSVTIK